MPVFSEIGKYPSIFLTVVQEKLVDLCPFQHSGNKESHGQCQKHTVGDADFTHKPKKKRQQKGGYHSRQKIKGNQSVFFTDGKIQHIVKYGNQADKTANPVIVTFPS